MTSYKTRFIVAAVSLIAAVPIHAQNLLSSGGGNGSVALTVDGWGMFGGCPNQAFHSDALFKNSAGAGPFATTCYSAILLDDVGGCPAPGRTLLALSDPFYGQFPSQSVNPAVNVIVANRHIQTMMPQQVCALDISIDQRLDGPDPAGVGPGGAVESSTLIQTYTITNTGATPRVFNLIHFTDIDLSAIYLANRAGASRRLADCGSIAPPFSSNKEWVFEYDPVNTPGVVVAIAAEGLDEIGQPMQTAAYRVHSSAAGHPSAAFTTNPVGFLSNTIDNDLNGDLLVTAPEATGDFAIFQGLSYSVSPGGTVTAVFRTRWTSLDASSPTSVGSQAREISCSAWNGNYSGVGTFPLLCVNGQSQCASVPPGAPLDISLSAPAAGPAATHYVVFGTFGQPIFGTGCGSPQAGDASLWGPPIGIIGFGAFPVSSLLATWNGGGAPSGLALISSLAGLALFTGPLATAGAGGCGGTTILAVPGVLPSGFSATLQAVVIDNGGASLPATLSNAVNLAIGCACQTH